MQKVHATELASALKAVSSPKRAKSSIRFFKTGPGDYAEGDKFIGVSVPDARKVAIKFKSLPLSESKKLIESAIHEERLSALLVLIEQFEKADAKKQEEIFNFTIKHRAFINNWDLVDGAAPAIIGAYLWQRDRSLLLKLAESKILWERRIAMVSCLYFIREKESSFALQIAEILLEDKHDLMHKALGWMLREIGKNCGKNILTAFLKKHYKNLPRTALHYAIEHFPPAERKAWLKGPV